MEAGKRKRSEIRGQNCGTDVQKIEDEKKIRGLEGKLGCLDKR